jgi:hypothetical protein
MGGRDLDAAQATKIVGILCEGVCVVLQPMESVERSSMGYNSGPEMVFLGYGERSSLVGVVASGVYLVLCS